MWHSATQRYGNDLSGAFGKSVGADLSRPPPIYRPWFSSTHLVQVQNLTAMRLISYNRLVSFETLAGNHSAWGSEPLCFSMVMVPRYERIPNMSHRE